MIHRWLLQRILCIVRKKKSKMWFAKLVKYVLMFAFGMAALYVVLLGMMMWSLKDVGI